MGRGNVIGLHKSFRERLNGGRKSTMTAKDKALVRASEIRARLAELAGAEKMGAEERAEIAKLRTEYKDVELRIQAATVGAAGPDDPAKPTEPTEPDAEERELLELRARVEFAPYLTAALERRGVVDGAEAEYNKHLNVPVDRFPLELLAPKVEEQAPRAEERAKINGDSFTSQGPWLDRLFSNTAASFLGITMPSVPAGISSYPVITSDADPKQRGRTEAASAATISATIFEIKPTRNAVHAVYSIEDDSRLPGLADAISRDLSAAMVEKIDRAIFKGDSGANENSADIVGLQTAGITEITLTQSEKVSRGDAMGLFAALVDGKHAGGLGDLNIVASVGSNTLWVSTFPTNNRNETLAQILRSNGVNWTTRGEIETATTNGKFGAYIGLQRGIENAAVAPVWNSGQMIVDPYSGAKSGEVQLSLNFLWGFKIPRTSSFRRLKYVT